MLWLPLTAIATQNVLAKVPFDFSKGEVIGEVRICGKGPFRVMFDTGTAPSVIDLALARQLGIKPEATGQAGQGGGTGKNLAFGANLPLLEIDHLAMKNVDCVAMDLSNISSRLGRHLDAVLGDSVFEGHVVQFDYPEGFVRFLRVDPGSSGTRFRFVHSDFEVHLRGLRINRRKVLGNLDTGAKASFQLTPRGIHKLQLSAAAAKGKAESSAGFNGSYRSRVGKVSSVDLGKIHRTSPEVTFWLPKTGHDESNFDVNIGNGFWKDYVITIDYNHHFVRVSNRAAG